MNWQAPPAQFLGKERLDGYQGDAQGNQWLDDLWLRTDYIKRDQGDQQQGMARVNMVTWSTAGAMLGQQYQVKDEQHMVSAIGENMGDAADDKCPQGAD